MQDELQKEELVRRLAELSMQKRLAFFLLLCERMYPALEKFCAETELNIDRYKEYIWILVGTLLSG